MTHEDAGTPSTPGASSEDPETVVREFFAAFEKNDAEALRGFLTDDVVYHNIPMDPAVGVDAAIAFIAGFFSMFESLDIDTKQLAVHGPVVLTERVDTMTMGDKVVPLPVMGALEVRDGRICAWRDYFDMGQITAAFT